MRMFILVELLFISAVSTVLGADYDDLFTRYKIWPMASAAYGDHPELCIRDNFANATFIRQYVIQCDIAKGDTCSGFTAVSHSDQAIILSFRGSNGPLQITNEGIEELLEPPSPFVGGGGVNKYFMDAFNDIWNTGMRNDFITLKNSYPNYEVWVTGHSLGASIASISAATISYLGYMSPEKIKLVSFGQPRVGTADYAAAVDGLVPYSFRVVHKHDIVPHLPPKGMIDYIHHKSEIWYNDNMAVGSAYIVCAADEGQQCSDSNLDLSSEDHNHYFNVNGDFAKNGCPGYSPNP